MSFFFRYFEYVRNSAKLVTFVSTGLQYITNMLALHYYSTLESAMVAFHSF